MKKRLLFITDSLQCDGAEKSLVSLLSQINFYNYDVDLMLLSSRNNFFRPFIPNKVRIIKAPEFLEEFFLPSKECIKIMLKRGHLKLLFYRVMLSLAIRLGLNPIRVSQRIWMRVLKILPSISGNYDAVIGYQDIWAGYYAAFKIDGGIKIGWNHHDYISMKRDPYIDKLYFEKLDHLVTVSSSCKDTLCKIFPQYLDKIRVIHNIVSPSMIKKMSKSPGGFNDDYEGTRILTIGRLCEQKGIDMAIKACAKLVKDGYNVRWYILGEGPDREKLKKMIIKHNLGDRFKLLGITPNPYPYLLQTDIYVQPSRCEGYGIAVAEARVLCKPIVVTDLEVFREQINDEVNGIIVPISDNGIYLGVKQLLDNIEMLNKITQNIKQEVLTENELKELYKLFK